MTAFCCQRRKESDDSGWRLSAASISCGIVSFGGFQPVCLFLLNMTGQQNIETPFETKTGSHETGAGLFVLSMSNTGSMRDDTGFGQEDAGLPDCLSGRFSGSSSGSLL